MIFFPLMNKNLALFSGILRKLLEFFNKLTIFPPPPTKPSALPVGPSPGQVRCGLSVTRETGSSAFLGAKGFITRLSPPGAGRALASRPAEPRAQPSIAQQQLPPAVCKGGLAAGQLHHQAL